MEVVLEEKRSTKGRILEVLRVGRDQGKDHDLFVDFVPYRLV